MFEFRMEKTTVCRNVNEVCEAIWNSLKPDFGRMRFTEDKWLAGSKDYEELWNFPHCLGAIDGKHVIIQAPHYSGSMFYNYKGTHSIVVLALCDARYHFLGVDISDTGQHSDGGVLAISLFGKALECSTRSIPPKTTLTVTVWTTAVERFVLSSLGSRVGNKCERYCKGHESHYIRATPSLEYSTLHLGQCVMRFMPFAVLLALIAHPTSGETQNETLNGSCPDCYCERNSLASRDY